MTISIDGKKIHYIREGSGSPILFVHGWGGSTHSLYTLARFFVSSHEVILLDLPGFGKSGPPHKNEGTYDYANLIKQFLSALGIKNVIYFGHSFGGSLGIVLCATQPTLISKLILCNSAFKRTDKKSNTASSLKRFIYSLPLINVFGPTLRKLGYKLFFRGSDLYKFPALESNFKKIMQEDLTPLLSRIRTQTLILWGKEDTQTPPALAYELKEKIQNSQLKIFPNERHNLPLIKPLVVAEEIRTFVHP